MADFEKSYSIAQANQPILASSWNQNIDATEERFKDHEHTGGEHGQQIKPDGLASEVFDTFASKEHNHNELLERIVKLEETVTKLEGELEKLNVLKEPPIIEEIKDYETGKPITEARKGTKIIINGDNFYWPLTVRFDYIVVPTNEIQVASDHKSITLDIPYTVGKGTKFITVSICGSTVSDPFTIN